MNFFPFIKRKKKNACRGIFRIKGAQFDFNDGNFDTL